MGNPLYNPPTRSPPGIEIISINYGGTPRFFARCTCPECGDVIDIAATNGGGPFIPTHVIEERARHKKWQVDATSRLKNRCPECAKNKSTPQQKDMPVSTPKLVSITPQPAKTAILSTASVLPALLNTHQRLAIRGLLDAHFDDGAGMWLDGYSDDKIAAECDVPRIHVTSIREAAYGPVKVSADLIEIQKEIVKLHDQINACEKENDRQNAASIETVRALRLSISALKNRTDKAMGGS